MRNDFEVAIVGGGLSGVSSAYHLADKGIETLIIEAGNLGSGSDDMLNGTNGPYVPHHSKVSTIVLPSTYKQFTKRNGPQKAKTYLELACFGRKIQKDIAKKLNSEVIRELGSLIVAKGTLFYELEKDMEDYLRFGEDVRTYSKNKICNIYGIRESFFDGGFFFPQDIIIDPKEYINLLSREIKKRGVCIATNTKVIGLKEDKDGVEIKTDKDETIKVDNLVLATNGFYNDNNLDGLLNPMWSFIVCFENFGRNSPFSWNFTHDKFIYWTRQDNILMLGTGEELKVENGKNKFRSYSREQDIIKELTDLVFKNFLGITKKVPSFIHFGITTDTRDSIPIIGKFSKESKICYIVGDNGVGQSTLSYGASLVPYLIFSELKMNETQRRISKLVSPERFLR